ncbi:MAG: hypothetical protein ABIH23_14000, partial [bacterium]
MSQQDTAHAWWSRLRHQGLLLSPVVMVDKYPAAPEPIQYYLNQKLRDSFNRFRTHIDDDDSSRKKELDQNAVLQWTDVLLEKYLGHTGSLLARQQSIPDQLKTVVRIGSRSETLRPHRVIFADGDDKTPALLVVADTSRQVGRGRGRTAYARFLELLRGTGQRLGLLTNGLQIRLVYAGLDFEAWCEWECERWFEDDEGAEELGGLRQILNADSLKVKEDGTPGLLAAVEESRKKQADLSSVLRENVRQAVESLLEEVSNEGRRNKDLLEPVRRHPEPVEGGKPLEIGEIHEALFQATVRVAMRLVVCLFAESRKLSHELFPSSDPVYIQSYGVRALYELLQAAETDEGGYTLVGRRWAWPRLMALFRLIHSGSAHGNFTMPRYGGLLFRPGEEKSDDAVSRALYVLEHSIEVSDATIYDVLRKLMWGRFKTTYGRTKTVFEGVVDYMDLRTEFIGLIYEGLLDYRVRRTDEDGGPQIFLNIGREPVLPLVRLELMLKDSKKELKDLLTKLRKEKVVQSASSDEEEAEESEEIEEDLEQEEEGEEIELEEETDRGTAERRAPDHEEADQRAQRWAREAVLLTGIARNKRKKQSDSEYDKYLEEEANKLIKRVIPIGEFYLVRAGNTRKGTGTFYTKPQLAVPTTHRTLEPLCYETQEDETREGEAP